MNQTFNRWGLHDPPADFGRDFIQWLVVASDKMQVEFVELRPLSPEDLQLLRLRYGPPHPELETFYEACNPWGAYAHGPAAWEKLVFGVYSFCRNALQARGLAADVALTSAPALWPIRLGKRNIAAFTDQDQRLAVIELRLDSVPARPYALGLRNYFAAIVVEEALLDEGRYSRVDEAQLDPVVRAVGSWPTHHAPTHPVLLPGMQSASS